MAFVVVVVVVVVPFRVVPSFPSIDFENTIATTMTLRLVVMKMIKVKRKIVVNDFCHYSNYDDDS